MTENNKRRFSITEKNGEYYTDLHNPEELTMLKNICEMRLGGLGYSTPNKLDKDSVEKIYDELVNITAYDPFYPFGTIVYKKGEVKPNLPRSVFIHSLDKRDVISFLLKYGKLDRCVEITREIVAEQKIWKTLPDNIDATAYKKGGYGQFGHYSTPVEQYIHETILEDDDYSYNDEEGELGWSQIDEYDVGAYRHSLKFNIEITLPKITWYTEKVKESA